MAAITIENLSLTYGDRVILRDFNATIAAGEFIGIFGPNGAGKSTLLRAILGLTTPSAGTIRIAQQPIQRGRFDIGYLPQAMQTVHTSQLCGRARLAAACNGVKWGLPLLNKQQREDIERTLHLVNAHEFADRPYAQLSGGERQRLLLAQALLNKPTILLLDEPLTNLDPRQQEILLHVVQQIQREEKVTVLFTAHDVNPLLGIMDRIIYLARGNGVIGTVDEVVTDAKLSWLYGMPIEVIRYKQQLYVINQTRGGMADDVAHHHAPIGHH